MDNIQPDIPDIPDTSHSGDTASSNTNVSNRATRARKPNKIPANLINPIDKSVTHLSKKQRSIIRRLPIADSMQQIADDLHCSKGYVSDTFKLPAVQDYLRRSLDAAGATHGKIFKRLAEGLDATRESADGKDRPDFRQRHTTAMDCLRLQGLSAPPEQGDQGQSAGTIYNIVINARESRGLEPKPITVKAEPVEIERKPE